MMGGGKKHRLLCRWEGRSRQKPLLCPEMDVYFNVLLPSSRASNWEVSLFLIHTQVLREAYHARLSLQFQPALAMKKRSHAFTDEA